MRRSSHRASSRSASPTTAQTSEQSSKVCSKCGSPYTGFGNTCGSCRKLGQQGSMVQCESCRSFFLGYAMLCEECNQKTQEAADDPALAVKLLQRSQGKAPAAQVLAVMAEQGDMKQRKSIVDAGGVAPLVRLLVTSRDAECKGMAARALLNIATTSKENRRFIGEAASVDEFLALLRKPGDEAQEEEDPEVELIAAHGLKVAAVLPPNKQAIVDKGGLPLLADRLRRWDEDGQACVCWALNNIIIGSTARKTAVFKTGVVPLLVKILRNGSADGRIAAAATLQNLAVVASLRDFIVEHGAVAPLVELLRDSTELGHIKACDALRNLALGSDARANNIAQQEEAIPLMVKIWESGGKEIKKSASDALKELSQASPLRLKAISVAGGAGAL